MMYLVLLSMMLVFCLRGGWLHNHLVFETDKILRGRGFITSRESPQKLPDGKLDFVDILAEKDGIMICFEVETTVRYVLTNAAKARQLGLPLIVVVPNKKVKKAVADKLKNSISATQNESICILLLSQLNKELSNYLSKSIVANKR